MRMLHCLRSPASFAALRFSFVDKPPRAAAMELRVSLATAALTMTTLLVTLVHADESALKAVMQCAKDSNIKIETLMKACDEDMSAVPGYKCFTKCVQQLMGIMDETGKFNTENACKFVADEDKDVTRKLAEECAKEVDGVTDLCERASAVNECSHKKNPGVYKKSCVALLAKMMS